MTQRSDNGTVRRRLPGAASFLRLSRYRRYLRRDWVPQHDTRCHRDATSTKKPNWAIVRHCKACAKHRPHQSKPTKRGLGSALQLAGIFILLRIQLDIPSRHCLTSIAFMPRPCRPGLHKQIELVDVGLPSILSGCSSFEWVVEGTAFLKKLKKLQVRMCGQDSCRKRRSLPHC